jgi:hypothetical protein
MEVFTMLTSSIKFDLFRPLTDEEKEELREPFKEIAKDLRELRDHFRKVKTGV